MPYVVIGPGEERHLFQTWAECEGAVRGRSGVRYMKVDDPVEAQAVLDGGVALTPGLYAFTDANAAGGIGVVVVRGAASNEEPPQVVAEIGSTVHDCLLPQGLPGLSTPDDVSNALAALANILAEMVALLEALHRVDEGSDVTIVYDYKGVEAFMTGAFKSKDEPIRTIVSAAHAAIRERGLTVRYRRQPGHRSSWAGRHDFATFNARADRLAAEAQA